MAAPVYRFLPWARRGLAQGIANPDNADRQPSRLARRSRSTSTSPARTATAARRRLRAGRGHRHRPPGDPAHRPAAGRDRLRAELPRRDRVRPARLPVAVHPGRARARGRLRPWCVLVVVEKGARRHASRSGADAPLPVLTIAEPAAPVAGAARPRASRGRGRTRRSSRTAGSGERRPRRAIPTRNLSRLVCPRRLKAETRYLACVVPAFDLGVARGLGRPVTAERGRRRRGRSTDSPLRRRRHLAARSTTSGSSRPRSRTTSSRWRAACTGPSTRPPTSAAAGSTPPPGTRTWRRRRCPPAARAITMDGALRPAESTGDAGPRPGAALTDAARGDRRPARHARSCRRRCTASGRPRSTRLPDAPAWFARAQHDRRAPDRRRAR